MLQHYAALKQYEGEWYLFKINTEKNILTSTKYKDISQEDIFDAPLSMRPDETFDYVYRCLAPGVKAALLDEMKSGKYIPCKTICHVPNTNRYDVLGLLWKLYNESFGLQMPDGNKDSLVSPPKAVASWAGMSNCFEFPSVMLMDLPSVQPEVFPYYTCFGKLTDTGTTWEDMITIVEEWL